jgi:hypothetical protein
MKIKKPCLYPLSDGRRCAECETCHQTPEEALTDNKIANAIYEEYMRENNMDGSSLTYIDAMGVRYGLWIAYTIALENQP